MGKKKKREENELKASVQKIWLAGLGRYRPPRRAAASCFMCWWIKGKEFDKGPVTKAKKTVEGAVKKLEIRPAKLLRVSTLR